MKPDPTNDVVELYVDDEGGHRWRRLDPQSHDKLSASTESYELASYCAEAAHAYNSDLPPEAFIEV